MFSGSSGKCSVTPQCRGGSEGLDVGSRQSQRWLLCPLEVLQTLWGWEGLCGVPCTPVLLSPCKASPVLAPHSPAGPAQGSGQRGALHLCPLVSEGVTTPGLPRDTQAMGAHPGSCVLLCGQAARAWAWMALCPPAPGGFNVQMCSKMISTNGGWTKKAANSSAV